MWKREMSPKVLKKICILRSWRKKNRETKCGRCMQVRSSSESSQEDIHVDTNGCDSTIKCPVCGFTEMELTLEQPTIIVIHGIIYMFDEMDWKCFNCQ